MQITMTHVQFNSLLFLLLLFSLSLWLFLFSCTSVDGLVDVEFPGTKIIIRDGGVIIEAASTGSNWDGHWSSGPLK